MGWLGGVLLTYPRRPITLTGAYSNAQTPFYRWARQKARGERIENHHTRPYSRSRPHCHSQLQLVTIPSMIDIRDLCPRGARPDCVRVYMRTPHTCVQSCITHMPVSAVLHTHLPHGHATATGRHLGRCDLTSPRSLVTASLRPTLRTS